ncbi:MAG: Der1-like protein [Amphiamblys sp. WSBS2006]|nr:MAG: Der1-like protein [Amphiamblys sp. WSBS2006]
MLAPPSAESDLFSWFFRYPPITRTYTGLVVLVAVLCHLGILHPHQLYFAPNLAFGSLQLWRVFTCFLYFCPITIDFFFVLVFFVRYCQALETDFYRGKKAEMVAMMLLGGCVLLGAACVFRIAFLADPLAFMLLYIWSRRSRGTTMSLFWILHFHAPLMPFILLGLSFLLREPFPMEKILGILVGHLYYFAKDVYEQKHNTQLISTPKLLLTVFGEHGETDEEEHPQTAPTGDQ